MRIILRNNNNLIKFQNNFNLYKINIISYFKNNNKLKKILKRRKIQIFNYNKIAQN